MHLFSTADRLVDAPVLMFSGGVDTFKIDVHAWCITLARRTAMTGLTAS